MNNLDEVERKRYETFKLKHRRACNAPTVKITFTPTGLGQRIDVKCPKCESITDISHYEVW